MSGNQSHQTGDCYWDRAGHRGYAEAMYRSSDVEAHVRGRLWKQAIEIAETLGVPRDGRVLDLGCGDGAFTNDILASHYQFVDGLDKSETAISRARSAARPHVSFRAVDLTSLDYEILPLYDAAFLIGILHHIKPAAPSVVQALGRRTNKMIILEPNGNHLLRKALEFTATYRDAGEDSFRTKRLTSILERAGWKTMIWRRLNLFPNFTPGPLYRLLAPIEQRIENSRLGKALCTVDLYGVIGTSAA
ncbi:MAG: class I SAM-dependent methyltransferase [Xanthobacteraceae bacterium]